jgi:hypothetical protein
MPSDGAAAAAAQPQVVLSQGYKRQLPIFKGDQEEEVNTWIKRIENWAQTTGVANNDLDKVLEDALTGEPRTWWNRIQRERDAQYTGWNELKDLIKKRFGQPLTPGQLIKRFGTLTQKSGESARAFEDRVRLAVLAFDEDLSFPAIPAGSVNRQQVRDETRRVIYEQLGKIFFLNGLPEASRETVVASNASTFEECVSAVQRMEVVRKPNTGKSSFKPSICELDQEQVLAVLEALNREKQSGKNERGSDRKPRRQGQEEEKPKRWEGERGGTRPAWLSDDKLPPRTCFRCGIPGHTKRNCKVEEAAFGWNALVKKHFPERAPVSEVREEDEQVQAVGDFRFM